MELAKLIAFNEEVKFENEDEKSVNIVALGYEQIKEYEEIINSYISTYNDINVRGGLSEYQITRKVVKPEFKDEYNAWKSRQDKYRFKVNEKLRQLEDLGYQFNNIEVLLPEEYEYNKDWYKEINIGNWNITYSNSQLEIELQKLKVKM